MSGGAPREYAERAFPEADHRAARCEAAIRTAAQPLVDALRDMGKARKAMQEEPGLMGPAMLFQQAYERGQAALAAWEQP